MAEFFDMGGYAWFVWPSYLVAAAVLIAMLALSLRSMRAREAELESLQAQLGSRRRVRPASDQAGEGA
jgi:heme exporter protein D